MTKNLTVLGIAVLLICVGLPLLVIVFGLLFTNGPIWIYFALCFWIIYFIICTYLLSKFFTFILSFLTEKVNTYFENRKKSKFQLSEKFSNYCDKVNKFMYSYFLPFIVGLILFLNIFSFSNHMAIMSTLKSELNGGEFEQLVDEIIIGNKNNISKTKAILAWFDEHSHNIYNDYRLQEQGKLIGKFYGGQIELYSTYPYIGIRTYGDNYPLWVLTSRYGHCGEYAAFFRAMADYAGLNVRKVCTDGENHCWNEVYINDTIQWKIVDPTNVFINDDRNGYDNVNLTWLKNKLGGNFSRVVGQEIDGKYINITRNYTTEINITVLTVNNNGEPISSATVKLLSNNRDVGRDTGLKGITNDTGQYTFTIGLGNYTFKASKGNYYGENTSIFSNEKLHHDFRIVLEQK